MHLHPFDPYRPLSSPIHRLDARSKLVLAFGFLLTTALTPPGAWPVYVLLLSLLLAVTILARIGPGYVMRRSALSLPFVLAALPLLFSQPGPLVGSAVVGPFHIGITAPGLVRFVSVALKSWISVQAAILLTATTPFPALLVGLRSLHVPPLLVAVIGLMWRYLFVLADEAVRLLQARTARSSHLAASPGQSPAARRKPGGTPGGRPLGGLPWRIKVTGGIAGSLLLRSLERSDRIYHAMLARGYDGEVRSLETHRLTAVDRFSLWVGLATFLSLLLLGSLFGG